MRAPRHTMLMALLMASACAYAAAPTMIPCNGDAATCARASVSVTDLPPIPPTNPTVDAVCKDEGEQTTMTSACVAGKQTVEKVRTWTTLTPASGVPPGKACPLATKTVYPNVACNMPPMPPDPSLPPAAVGWTTLRIGLSSERPTVPGDGTGAFRTRIEVSHYGFNDPIVFPGQRGASHCHTFFGNTSTDENSTQASMAAANSSTATGGIANLSGYWFPCLRDASGNIVKPQYLQAYYKQGYNDIPRASIESIPFGLKYVAGKKPTDIGPVANAWESPVYFECNSTNRQQYIPACNGQLSATVSAPNCWDGVNLDSPDHRSHMAYSGGAPGSGGKCPASHPHALPQISVIEVFNVSNTNGYKFSSDTAPGVGGWSFHFDYWGLWQPEIESLWLNNCVKKPMDCHNENLGDMVAFPPNGRRLQ